ncbi:MULTISPECIES: hypothetical protein [Clostridium]|uniref:Uncharacterized protein n=1 Tax=Clostridium botulinum TaxID=1491 RepID=A0A6B4RLR7_CLOBO|nr:MULTISPECIES: hypothetical protein [Clostridium]EES50406.1 cell wall binding repeat protein [Clostridium botulinum E1 str. 'BoNT E Beluga']KIL07989.1 collagenolytic protease [Clostridium botulinum]MBN1043322.1 hypothetical protein [Clostridium botulinum]MBY6759540.1 hypothetical protein [Clostridium botulinum]MBY6837767.1 hypothetical protein [Clostridium botulinum]
MIRRIIKRSLLVLMATFCFNIVNCDSNSKVYATTTESSESINNLNLLSGEKLIKISEEKNQYKTSIYNNIERAIINYEFLSDVNIDNINIEILNPNKNEKSANYVLDKTNLVILIDNLQVGLTEVIIKDKLNEKQICKLYIDYNKNYNDNDEVGWVKSLGEWYFIDPSTRDKKTYWLLHNGYWYYLGEDGVMKNGWVLDSDKWYYLNSTGIMESGLIKDESGNIYHLNEDGSLNS